MARTTDTLSHLHYIILVSLYHYLHIIFKKCVYTSTVYIICAEEEDGCVFYMPGFFLFT